MSVRVHIDRLVVDAAIAGDPATLEAGIVAALDEVLGGPRPGWWSRGASVSVVQATLPPGADAGARIGAAIHQGLASPPEQKR